MNKFYMNEKAVKFHINSEESTQSLMPFKECQTFLQLFGYLEPFEMNGSLDLICQKFPKELIFSRLPLVDPHADEIIAALSVLSSCFRAQIITRRIDEETVWVEGLNRILLLTSQIEKKNVPLRQAKARYHLAQAALYRKNNHPLFSVLHSKRSLSLLNRDCFLWGEAQFSLALSLSLIGRSFDCLAVYIQARKAISTTSYRRMMCALNEAHERFILSDLEGVRLILPELPPEKSFRLQLQLDLLENTGNIQHHQLALETLNLLPSESGPALLLLIEDALLKSPVDMIFLRKAIAQFRNHPFWNGTEFSTLLTMTYLHFLEGKIPPGIPAIERLKLKKRLQLKDYIDFVLHRALCFAALENSPSEDWIELNELITEHRMFTPMIPMEQQCLQGRFPWHQRFCKRLGLSSNISPNLILDLPARRIIYDGVEIDLAKHPKSLELIQALSECQPVATKAQIHQHISGTKYVSHLHDQRLRMLLGRLREKIQKSFGIDLLELPGDNLIHLKVTIKKLRRLSI